MNSEVRPGGKRKPSVSNGGVSVKRTKRAYVSKLWMRERASKLVRLYRSRYDL